jgi:hypothetical protein
LSHQPAQVTLDGNAKVRESVVFAVLRPLNDCTVDFEVRRAKAARACTRGIVSGRNPAVLRAYASLVISLPTELLPFPALHPLQ